MPDSVIQELPKCSYRVLDNAPDPKGFRPIGDLTPITSMGLALHPLKRAHKSIHPGVIDFTGDLDSQGPICINLGARPINTTSLHARSLVQGK